MRSTLWRQQTWHWQESSSQIPVDQVIDAMGEVGMKMDVSLRETSMGGVATSPKGLEIAERLRNVNITKRNAGWHSFLGEYVITKINNQVS